MSDGMSKAVAYEERAVAFVDILGFQGLVDRADDDPSFRVELIESLSKVRAAAPPPDQAGESDLKAQNFSDSLILSARSTPLGMWHLLFALDALSWNLLDNGVLARGAVTIGNVFHDESTVFGKGVNEAYGLESTVANVPRIILSRKALSAADSFAEQNEVWKTYRQSRIRRDEDDGVWFLNYLLDLGAFNRPNGNVVDKQEHPLFSQGSRIRQLLQHQIDEAVESPRIYEKLAWVGRYWNHEVSSAAYWAEDLALPPLRLAGEEPRAQVPFTHI